MTSLAVNKNMTSSIVDATCENNAVNLKKALKSGEGVNGEPFCLLAIALSNHYRQKDRNECGENALRVFNLLLAAGAHTNRKLFLGQTVLFEALKTTHDTTLHICEQLLRHGADPNAMTPEGYTPLHVAAENNNVNALALLFVFGAIPQAGATTPLDSALSRSNFPIASWLAEPDQCCPVFAAIRYDLGIQLRFVLRAGIVDPDTLCCLRELRKQKCINHPFATMAFAPWSIARHCVFHPGVRNAVKTVFLIAKRRPSLAPQEVWELVCKHFWRKDFPIN